MYLSGIYVPPTLDLVIIVISTAVSIENVNSLRVLTLPW